ncbi:hypothetical protein BAE44_0023646 [Dichanthelium oligosanthes]|uniref:Uncharacterized protein n=1 Tax=Dichanthelium oligosanthes TaxID=888268 RepID=A0A1E5URA8_9POAL|nr:hypothetical protein BAE44_0023646 [Dichanthelium oligosanthes]
MRPLLGGRKSGGSNSRTPDYQLPHHFTMLFLTQMATTTGTTARNDLLSLPSYWSSQHTSNILHTSRTRATSLSVLGNPTVSNPAQSFFQPPPSLSSVLGKRPTTSNPSQSFFHPPSSSSVLGKRITSSNPVQSLFQPLHPLPSNADEPPPPLPSNADDMELETDELLSLVQSMGTPGFLTTSNLVQSFFQPPPPLPSNADDMELQSRLETDELLSLVRSMGTPEFLTTRPGPELLPATASTAFQCQ